MSELPTGIEEQKSQITEQKQPKKFPILDRFLGLTRPTKVPGTEHDRGLVERLERAKIAKTYKAEKRKALSEIPKKYRGEHPLDASRRRIDALVNDPEFKSFRGRTDVLQKNLDILNTQFYDNIERVHVVSDVLGEHNIPVVTLDLNPPKEGEKDERIPYFIVPTYVANPDQVAAFAMSLSLEGQRVHIMTYPEKYKMSESDPSWLEKVKQDGTLKLYTQLAENITDGMGLDNFNLVGLSMGAPIVMEMASDPDFCRKINDLIAVDPPSIVDKSGKRLVFDFLIREGFPAAMDTEQIVKSSFASHRPEMTVSMKGVETVVAPILGRAQITPEKIEQINPKGKFEVWTGGKSSITGNEARRILVEAEKKRRIDHPDSSPMRVINIPEFNHQNLFSTSGMAEKIVAPDTYSTTEVVIQKEELVTNGAQALSRGKQFSPSTVS